MGETPSKTIRWTTAKRRKLTMGVAYTIDGKAYTVKMSSITQGESVFELFYTDVGTNLKKKRCLVAQCVFILRVRAAWACCVCVLLISG
jgi:hypothetical protein